MGMQTGHILKDLYPISLPMHAFLPFLFLNLLLLLLPHLSQDLSQDLIRTMGSGSLVSIHNLQIFNSYVHNEAFHVLT